ncbi:hypothetical protein V6N13_074623 [Hibiscus sabdariffa]
MALGEEESSVPSNSKHCLAIETIGQDKDALALSLTVKDLHSPSLKSSMEYLLTTLPPWCPHHPPHLFQLCSHLPNPGPRISFSFPVPRISFAKAPVSHASNAKLGSCDVFIGFHGQNPNLGRFCKWLKSELELQGIACFVADRTKYSDTQSHEIADRIICSVTYGVVVVTSCSFLDHLSLEEIRFFNQKKNLIPVFFDTGTVDIMELLNCNSIDKECKEAMEGVIKCHDFNLEANQGNWRSCVAKTAALLRAKLGRKSVAKQSMVLAHPC